MAATCWKLVTLADILFFIACCGVVDVKSVLTDTFSEELFIKSLDNGFLLSHFQFTTIWNASTANPNSFTHYRLFPKSLGEVLVKYRVQELHLSQTQGLWKYDKWGYPPEDAPPGVELWVWFLPGTNNIDQTWAELVNALSGLFCTSLNFMDMKSTVIPRWSFRPAGLASEYYSFDSRFMRYSAQPREMVCTENLTPWEKLLPCESEVGLATLFNPMRLYDASYHSLGIHVRPICANDACTEKATELKQTLTIMDDRSLQAKVQNWDLRTLFSRNVRNVCPMAKLSKIYVDITRHQSDAYKLTLNPEPSDLVHFVRGREKTTYATYDIPDFTSKGGSLNIHGTYNAPVTFDDIDPPPLYANRFITGYGLEKGGIKSILYNNLDTNLTVIYLETIPWFIRLYLSSVKIEAYGIPVKPYKTHYIPGKDRMRSYHLEIVFRLRPYSVTTVTMEFDRTFLKWTEYPPDANHGFYLNSAVISTMLPSGSQYTALPQNASTFDDSMRNTTDASKFFLRIHTESLLVSLPTPDFSMPYNVICLACTVIAIAFGSLHNLTTRSFVALDPAKVKPGPLGRLKNFIMRKKVRASEEQVKDQSKEEVAGEETDKKYSENT